MKPMFYNKLSAISHEKHSDYFVNHSEGYPFAANTNSVPVGVAEFLSVAATYPIVFLQHEDSVHPVIVLGLDKQKNAWVGGEGEWLGKYIPAYLRRYPFMAVRTSSNELTLCIDESAEMVNRNQKGEALFIENKQSDYLKRMLKLAEAYEIEQQRNGKLSDLLQKYELLEPSQLNRKSQENTGVLSGFLVVSRKKLETLDKEALADLHQQGAMELIFQHLFSLERFQGLVDQMDDMALDTTVEA